MTSNLLSMIQQELKMDFDEIISEVGEAGNGTCTADQMEHHLWQQMLKLGGRLMQLFFEASSQAAQRDEVYTEEGQRIPYHCDRKRKYISIFGELSIRRPYFYHKEVGSQIPLDARLGLADDCYSDFVRELHEELSVFVPYEKTEQIPGRLLDIHLSKRVLQEFVSEDAADVQNYYEQLAPPPATEEGFILVVQADGKGVPMIRPSNTGQKVRLRRGEARSRKKAANVTALYTIQSAPRTPDEVLQSLLSREEGEEDPSWSSERHRPQNKQLWATMTGKQVALECLAHQVDKREGAHILERVMLSDGDRHLQRHLQETFPDFTLILDFIHAYEYLWKAANVLYGEGDEARLAWVTDQTRLLLNNRVEQLIDHLRQLAASSTISHKQKQLNKIANYLEKNKAFMQYATYLQRGWPIASGVIEGACRHFVKDRLELSGMRWSYDGAESMLHLRAVAINDDWDDYHQYRKQCRQQRLYNCDWPTNIFDETPASHQPPIRQSEPDVICERRSLHVAQSDYCTLPLAT
jgi:hypothetical protein